MTTRAHLLAWLLVSCFCARADQEVSTDDTLAARFESSYIAWQQHCNSYRVIASSSTRVVYECDEYRTLRAMDLAILPFVASKSKARHPKVDRLWLEITKMQRDPTVNPWATDPAHVWWEGGRELARERFQSQYREWKKANQEGRPHEAEKYQKAIRSMGILALGPLMEQVDSDDAVVVMITDVVGDEIGDKKADKRVIQKWWATNKEKYELPVAKR